MEHRAPGKLRQEPSLDRRRSYLDGRRWSPSGPPGPLAALGRLTAAATAGVRACLPGACRSATLREVPGEGHSGRCGAAGARGASRTRRTQVSASITAFFPAYNDAGTIASMAVVMDLTLRRLVDDYEIIVVNDGSPDHTGDVLADLATRYPRLRVITHPKNRGYGGALRSGFAHATKDLVFYTDGDAQYDPREITRLLPALTPDVDMVNGYKIERHDPMHRIIIGRIYHHAVKA